MKRFVMVAVVALCAAVVQAGFFNVITLQEVYVLPSTLVQSGGINVSPTAVEYRAAGWRSFVSFVVPDGYATVMGTRRLVVDGDAVAETWDVETVADAEQRRFVEQADSLPDDLMGKYVAFHSAYANAVAAAIGAGAEVPENVTFEVLVNVLGQLEGDQWTKIALGLTALWNAVVVVDGGNLATTYDKLPLMEYRRLNP